MMLIDFIFCFIPDASTSPPSISSSTTLAVARRLTSRNRDNKLMSVLQTRRNNLNRDRWLSIGKSNATSFPNDHPVDGINSPRARNIGTSNSSIIIIPRHLGIRSNYSSNNNNSGRTSISNNSIVESVDEYLEMDESVHQAYNISLNSSVEQSTPPSPKLIVTKEPRTYVNINRTKTRVKTDESENKEIIQHTTVKTTRLYYDTRQKPYRGKARFMPEKSMYDSELLGFAGYGQKVSTTTPKSETNRLSIRKRGHIATKNDGSDNKIKDERLEILDVSVPPRSSSTEKARLWQKRFNQVTRNVMAYNNFVRRAPIYSEAIRVDPTLTIIRPTTLRPRSSTQESIPSGLNSVNSLIEGTAEPKEVYSRSTNLTEIGTSSTTTTSTTTESIETTTTMTEEVFDHMSNRKVPGLIINIPEDATPEGVYISNPNKNLSPAIYYTTPNPNQTPSTKVTPEIVTTINVIEEIGDEPKAVVVETTRNGGRSLHEKPSEGSVEIKAIVEPSSTETPISTTTQTVSPKTTVRTTTNPPLTSTRLTTTIKPLIPTTTTTSTTQKPFTTSTTRMRTKPSTTRKPPTFKTYPPNNILDYLSSSSQSSSAVTPSVKPSFILNSILPPQKTQNSGEVTIEMNNMNIATYVLIALGMVPIVAILLYAIRTLIINRDNKSHLDMLDGQPISPVVRLDQSDTSSSADESILVDGSIFNRNNLRFKSLLGEGNFGQVWKAEVDDLTGHLQGTTRIVAVKTERRDNGQGGLKAEAEIMKKLGQHQNVVTLLGACTEQGEL